MITKTEKARDAYLSELAALAYEIWKNDPETEQEIILSFVCVGLGINDPYIIQELKERAKSWRNPQSEA